MSSEEEIDTVVSVNGKISGEKTNSSFCKRHIVKIKFIVVTFIILLIAIVLIKISDVLAYYKSEEGEEIVKRAIWGAKSPIENPRRLKVIPAPYVIIGDTNTKPCFIQAQCILRMRHLQKVSQEQFSDNDIPYNFVVGGDGNVYEGRGWDIEGDHTYKYNDKSIGISFIIGEDFEELPIMDAQIAATQKLLKFGLENGKISQDYKLLFERQFWNVTWTIQDTIDKFYEIIQTWDHWSPTP